MNNHALRVIEFPRVLELVAGRATSELGAALIRRLEPHTDRQLLEGEHARVASVRSIIQGEQPWHPEPLPNLVAALARLRVEGVVWSGAELLAGAQLLRSSRRTRDALRDERRPALARAVLAPLADRLLAVKPLEDSIERTFDDDGSVKDDASPALRRVRRELRAAEGELVRLLERVIEHLEPHHRVSDMSVTVREGRYVIPVRREGRGSVGGIVHGTSATGATLFVEPPAAVEFGNRIRELEAEEREEVDRILRELTESLRPHREAMIDATDALAALDALFARARFALEFRCLGTTIVSASDGFIVRDGRHPLLLAQGIAVVPFDLEMDAAQRTLLVSGPNTGGKTVLLKALALISAMAQSGIPAPTGAESRVAAYDDFFADIGDEQSIEASLSTFSAHVKNLSEIMRSASPSSLVLIDELGSGTDPVEGSALGWAVLEALTHRGTMTIATTHLGALKELATEVQAVVNASLQFDADALAPTYRLIKGIPGRSYGISIARRLALPEDVVARAEERLPQQERDVAALIEQLEQRSEALTVRDRETAAILDDARKRMADLARREHNVRERERRAERESRQETRRYLLDARQEIERTLRELRKTESATLEEAAREARHQAEQLAARQAEELERLDREEANVARRESARATPPRGATREITVGTWVDLATLGGKQARVVEIRDTSAVVTVGAIKMTVPLSSLTPSEEAPLQVAISSTADHPDEIAPTEIDLRGMRVDEAEGFVMQALDAAVRADLRSLRIIHGKGTGALRERV
ncbi:MAG TPA: endonuclease MutS2, partial [Gemmatimonadaceae bacterium]|nr:endonuclease MutS2 [Gemmatimonadaceae bacterium]